MIPLIFMAALLLQHQPPTTHPGRAPTICVEIRSLGVVHWSQTVPVVEHLPRRPLPADWQMRFVWSKRALYVPSAGRWVPVERAHYEYKHGECE